MCEESACLVPPMEQTSNGTTESRLTNENNNNEMMVDAIMEFHENAISQAAVGKAQILLAIILGFALAADCSEIVMLNFILPIAELHLCIEEHKKDWLVSITFLAMALGSFIWGLLGDSIGRRQTLILSLIVSTLFLAVTTVMPTYGTFMNSWFCSGLSVAGIFPVVFTYLAEICPRTTRAKYVTLLYSIWPVGAFFTSIIFYVTMPTLGADIVRDNGEHWSSWHRFLILNTLPIIGCLLGLICTFESPRYLLEVSREVEALAVYQKLHKLNNKSKSEYRLTELELPRYSFRERQTSTSGNIVYQAFELLRETYQKLCSPLYLRTTILLAIIHFLLGHFYMGITTFSETLIKEMREQRYLSHRKLVENQTFSGPYNETMENVFFNNCFISNATFSHMNLIHVNFQNCIFNKTEFIDVKTSVFFFENSIIKNSKFIDTDITNNQFIHCELINNTFHSIVSNCLIDFDYNLYLEELCKETLTWSGCMVPLLWIFGNVMIFPRPKMAAFMIFLTAQAGAEMLVLHFIQNNPNYLTFVETIVKIPLMCSISAITLVVTEAYPCHLRCTVHGLMRCIFHIASLCAIPVFTILTRTILLFPSIFLSMLSVLTGFLCLKLQDNSNAFL